MSSNNNRLLPISNKSWNIFNDNRLSEDCSIEIVSDGAIWTLPHFFQLEFFNSGLIWGDGGTLDSDLAFLDGFGSIKGDLIVGFVSVFDS